MQDRPEDDLSRQWSLAEGEAAEIERCLRDEEDVLRGELRLAGLRDFVRNCCAQMCLRDYRLVHFSLE